MYNVGLNLSHIMPNLQLLWLFFSLKYFISFRILEISTAVLTLSAAQLTSNQSLKVCIQECRLPPSLLFASTSVVGYDIYYSSLYVQGIPVYVSSLCRPSLCPFDDFLICCVQGILRIRRSTRNYNYDGVHWNLKFIVSTTSLAACNFLCWYICTQSSTLLH